MEVGRFYAALDEIEAQIAEEELKLVPDDEEIKKKVEELRRRAEESAASLNEANQNCHNKFNPTPEAKKAYHNLARMIHPDLAIDEAERERRHALMAKLNQQRTEAQRLNVDSARYFDLRMTVETKQGLLATLQKQLSETEVAARLRELQSEKLKAELSEAYAMRGKVRAEQIEGRNYFRQMSGRAKTHIMKARRRLENLKHLNVAQEDYVQEKYGMDISEFR